MMMLQVFEAQSRTNAELIRMLVYGLATLYPNEGPSKPCQMQREFLSPGQGLASKGRSPQAAFCNNLVFFRSKKADHRSDESINTPAPVSEQNRVKAE